jgi:hypothetical protein
MITAGTILIAQDAPRPTSFQIEGDSSPTGWLSVTHKLSALELETELKREGWTFFYIAISIKKIAFGFDRARMVDAALVRIIRAAMMEGCNCVQIDQVAAHSFLWIPYISVSAHPRHVQRSSVFSGR